MSTSCCPQNSIARTHQSQKNGLEAQSPLPLNTSRKLKEKEIKAVQKIVGSILYYACAVDMTVHMALSTIASEQTNGTEHTIEKALQLLAYLAAHPDTKILYRASDMILEKDGYVRNVPLPQVPRDQRASPEPTAPKNRNPLPGYLQVPSWIPTLPKIGNIPGFSQRVLLL